MNKFNTCREILLRSYAENHNSDEEFVPLNDCYRSKIQTWLSIVRCFRSTKHEFSWLQGQISSWKGRPASPCRCFTDSSCVQSQTEKHLRWLRGTVCAAKTKKSVHERDFLSLLQTHSWFQQHFSQKKRVMFVASLHRPRVKHNFDKNEDSKQLKPLSNYLTHLHFCIWSSDAVTFSLSLQLSFWNTMIKMRFMPKAIQINHEKAFSWIFYKVQKLKGQNRTSING